MRSVTLFVFVLLAGSAQAAEPEDHLPPLPEGKAWKLVWQDEFNGDTLDESKWTVWLTLLVFAGGPPEDQRSFNLEAVKPGHGWLI